MAYLSNVHELDLWNNKNITDAGLAYLSNIHSLDLFCNENITDKWIKTFNGHTLDLNYKYIK